MSRSSRYDPANRPKSTPAPSDSDSPLWMRGAGVVRGWWAKPRGRWSMIGAAGLVVVGLLTWALWPAGSAPEKPRARQYLAFTACLLTDQAGTRGKDAAPFWAGMQDASLKTRAKVQYLEVTGPQTADNAATFLATLAQGNCNLIFAAGKAQTEATVRSAATFPKSKFLVVGDHSGPKNVAVLDTTAPDALSAAVSRRIVDAVRS